MKIQSIGKLMAIPALLLASARIPAEEHTEEAIRHAGQAARASGDSASVKEHATEALRHLDAAKAANRGNPEALQHLRQGEANLNEAISHARRYNSQSAGEEAGDARHHLEQAGADSIRPRHPRPGPEDRRGPDR